MEVNRRNTYLISGALKNFVLASVLTAAAAQLASTCDAIVLAQFEGEEAMSALSLVLPVTTFISCVGLLLAFGANALSAKAIGRHDLDGAAAIFSTAVWSILTIGVGVSVLAFFGVPVLMRLITDEPSLRELPAEYLRVYTLGAWLEMLSYALCLFVAADGHPRRVTVAVVVGMAVNIIVDVLAVGYLDWGIVGVACGTLCQFVANILMLSLYFRRPSCSYRLTWPTMRWRQLFRNMQGGASVSIGNVLMSVSVLLIGNICFNALGERGFFFWSVCLQVLLVTVVFINGVIEALFAIGGTMLGEHDLNGFRLLARRALLGVSVLVGLLMLVLFVPDVVGVVFGVEDPSELAALNHVVRIFSLMLIPFSCSLILVAVYQVLELDVLSVVSVVSLLALLIGMVYCFSMSVPGHLWYAFPLGAFLFLGLQLLCSYARSRMQHGRVSGLTLIPYSSGGHSLDCSVHYQQDEVAAVLLQMRAFLEEAGIDKPAISGIEACCEELMTAIVLLAVGRVTNHSFDVHVYAKRQSVLLAIKYGGRPFDPLGLGKRRIAANVTEDVSYKYMYGQNVVLIKVNQLATPGCTEAL